MTTPIAPDEAWSDEFTGEQSRRLRELLGLPLDTTDAELILDTIEDLIKQVEEAAERTKPSDVAAAAKRQGLEVIDADTLAALRRDAAEGRQIKAAAQRQQIEATVAEAITKGKITASRRKHWIDLITADPAMADVLASVPDETAVPLSEIGHGLGDEENHPRTDWFY